MTFTKPTGIQQRTLRGTQLRAESQGDEMALVGYAATFNTLSQDLGGFREMIAPGAFTRSLAAGCDCKCLFNHDPSKVLGRMKSGTLTVSEDERGLKFRCELDVASATARDVYAAVKRGDIDECSFAFTLADDGDLWDESTDERGNKFMRRTLRNVNLLDVSAVTYPAYDKGTAVQARSADYVAGTHADSWATEMRKKLDAAMQPPVPSTAELKARAARLAETLTK